MSVNFKDDARAPLPLDHVIFTDLDGVEGVLVDLNAKQYYQLNETASVIWRGVAKGMSAAGIAIEIADLYDVTPEHARSSVEGAIDKFISHRLMKANPD